MDETHLDGFELNEELSNSSVCRSFRATELSLGRDVLLKALHPDMLSGSVFAASLEQEARLLAGFRHEQLPRLLHFHPGGRIDGKNSDGYQGLWLATEFVDGRSLNHVLHDFGRLPAEVVCAILYGLSQVLGYIHQTGIVHADLHPQHVLLRRDGEVLLCGLRKARSEGQQPGPEALEQDRTSGPIFLAPEAIVSESVSASTDIFALGILGQLCLVGKGPFGDGSIHDQIERIRHHHPFSLAEERNIPPALERIITRCLQKLPQDRFHNAEELGNQLLRPLAGRNYRDIIHDFFFSEAQSDSEANHITQAAVGPLPQESGTASNLSFLRSTLLAFLPLLITLIAGALLIRALFPLDERPERSAGKLELLPKSRAEVRVVVRPWAKVYVDGQYFDTTPFATAIPLSAGKHFFRLEHPKAAIERRELDLQNGDSLLLDISMDIPAQIITEELPKELDAGPPSP